MKDVKENTGYVSQNVSAQLENQIMKSSPRNDNIIEQLQITVGEINKFFDEDLQRDIPTGLLPCTG